MLWIQEQKQPFPERLDGSRMRIARQAKAPVIAPPLGRGMVAHKGARVAKGRSQRAAAALHHAQSAEIAVAKRAAAFPGAAVGGGRRLPCRPPCNCCASSPAPIQRRCRSCRKSLFALWPQGAKARVGMGCKAQTADGPYGPARICNAAGRPRPRFRACGRGANRLLSPQALGCFCATGWMRRSLLSACQATAPGSSLPQ